MLTLRLIADRFPAWIAWLFIALDALWELPQNLAGLVVALCTGWHKAKRETVKDGEVTVFTWKLTSGLSLGWFQFVNESASVNTVSHEVGHSRQSYMLGWLYLLSVGAFSLLWAGVIHKYFMKDKSYYWAWCEAWADKLGGVVR